MFSENELREKMISICRRMYQRELVSGTDGNVSCKIEEGMFLITPSDVSKATLNSEDLVIIRKDGKVMMGRKKPSSEYKMHLKIYETRKDVQAIVHAHPIFCTAFTIAGLTISHCVMPEVIASFGEVKTIKYETPGSEELAFTVSETMKYVDVALMDRHGAISVGRDLQEAYDRIEKLEFAAQVSFIARQLGQVKPLPKEEVKKLLEIYEKKSGRKTILGCVASGGCLKI